MLGGVTHLGFMDACTIAADQGGILQVAAEAGRRRARGDRPASTPTAAIRKYTPAPTAWPAIRHLTIAQLRAAFGIDPAPVGLDTSLGRRLRRPDDPLPVRLTVRSLRPTQRSRSDRA